VFVVFFLRPAVRLCFFRHALFFSLSSDSAFLESFFLADRLYSASLGQISQNWFQNLIRAFGS